MRLHLRLHDTKMVSIQYSEVFVNAKENEYMVS